LLTYLWAGLGGLAMAAVLGITMAGSTFMDAHHAPTANAKAESMAGGIAMLLNCTALCALILVPASLAAVYAWRVVKPK
jgi:hypothetical protein